MPIPPHKAELRKAQARIEKLRKELAKEFDYHDLLYLFEGASHKIILEHAEEKKKRDRKNRPVDVPTEEMIASEDAKSDEGSKP